MGTTLTGTTPQDTYDSLIKVTDNGPLSATAKYLSDGLGNDSVLALSTSRVGIGTTSLQAQLHIDGTSAESSFIMERDTVGANAVIGQIKFTNNNGTTTYGTLLGGRNAAGDGYSALGTGVGTNLYAVEGGNVGIGTSAPNIGGYVAGITVLTMAPSDDDKFSVLQLSGNRGSGENQNGNIDFVNSEGTATITSRISGLNDANALDGQIVFETRTSAGSLTERLRITSTGVVELAQGQIKFPATQVASADANTLDDYEEGTWTATLTDGTVTKTATCSYTKIGRMVYIAGSVSNVEDPSSFTGSVYITGVPFVPAFSVSLYGFNNYLATASVFAPYLESNQQIRFYKVGAASADNDGMQGSDLDFYSDIYFAGQFTV